MTIVFGPKTGTLIWEHPSGKHGSFVKPADRHGHVDIAALRPTGGQGLAIKRLVVYMPLVGLSRIRRRRLLI